MKQMKKISVCLAICALMISSVVSTAFATCDTSSLSLPSKYGTLKSNSWRSTKAISSKGNNNLKWEYQVSAQYSGKKTIKSIRTTWKASASLRKSCSISLGISNSGVKASSSSSWKTVSSKSKYWENTNGAKSSSYRSNVVITPKKDYRSDTISVINTAKLCLKGDKRSWSISAAA